MSVLQMQRISICAMKKDRKAVLEALQELGVLEIETSRVPADGLDRLDTAEEKQRSEKQAMMLDQALDVLQEYAPEKTSIFASLEGKKTGRQRYFPGGGGPEGRDSGFCGEAACSEEERGGEQSGSGETANTEESLTPWLALDIPMSSEGTKKTKLFIGSIGSVLTQEEILTKIAELEPDLSAVDVELISADKDQTCLTAVCLRSEADRLEEALRACGFSRPAQTGRMYRQKRPKNRSEAGRAQEADRKIAGGDPVHGGMQRADENALRLLQDKGSEI